MPNVLDYYKKWWKNPIQETRNIYNYFTQNEINWPQFWETFRDTARELKYLGKKWWYKKTDFNFSPGGYLQTPAVQAALKSYFDPSASEFSRQVDKAFLNKYRINPVIKNSSNKKGVWVKNNQKPPNEKKASLPLNNPRRLSLLDLLLSRTK